MNRHALFAAALLALLSGCAGLPRADQKFLGAQPRSIVVVPVMNNTVDVGAPDFFLSTIAPPVANRGYYVFPVNLVKRLLEDDGLGDPAVVHGADPRRLASLFGADAVLYISIERWEAKYMVLQTKVTVELEYTLKSGTTGDTLWKTRRRTEYVSDDAGAGLLGAVVMAAATRASPNYIPLARAANRTAMLFPGPGFPAGRYHPAYGKDYELPLEVVATQRTDPAGTPAPSPPKPALVPAASPAR